MNTPNTDKFYSDLENALIDASDECADVLHFYGSGAFTLRQIVAKHLQPVINSFITTSDTTHSP